MVLKNGKTLKISLLADICERLRNNASFGCPYLILKVSDFQDFSIENYSNEDVRNTFDLLATKLPFAKNSNEDEDLGKMPFFEIDGFYIWFPHLMLQTDFLNGILNKIWDNIIPEERNKVSHRQAEILKDLLKEQHNFSAFANHEFEDSNGKKSPEFDLVAHSTSVLFVAELKTTNFRNSDKGVYLHKKEAFVKAKNQIEKRLEWISKNGKLLREQLNMKGEIMVVSRVGMSPPWSPPRPFSA